jgi:hypothetical protein
MWRNIMRLTKSQKVSILHYSIDIDTYRFQGKPISKFSFNFKFFEQAKRKIENVSESQGSLPPPPPPPNSY